MRPYLEKPFTKIGLVQWLKVKALSSSPSTAKKKKKKKRAEPSPIIYIWCNKKCQGFAIFYLTVVSSAHGFE
jgi:hypothetical protein